MQPRSRMEDRALALRAATEEDLPRVLLLRAGRRYRPRAWPRRCRDFFVAESDGKLVGVAGLELYGANGAAPIGRGGGELAGAAASARCWWTGCWTWPGSAASRTCTC